MVRAFPTHRCPSFVNDCLSFTASRVCRRWRDIALNNATLWARHTLAILQPSAVKTFLSRSKEVPIAIHLTWEVLKTHGVERSFSEYYLPSSVSKSIDHAFDEAWRAKDIHLSGTATFLADLLYKLTDTLRRSGRASVLQSFTLETRLRQQILADDGPHAFLSSDLLGGDIPTLNELFLKGLPPPWPYPLFGLNIKHLSLRFSIPDYPDCLPPSYTDLFAFLETLSRLESLELEKAFPEEISAPTTQYSLPNLRHIVLWARPSEVCVPFRHLLVHRSNSLHVISRTMHDMTAHEADELALQFPHPSSSSISLSDERVDDVRGMTLQPIRFLKVAADVNIPLIVDGTSSVAQSPFYDGGSDVAVGDFASAETHITFETVPYVRFVDAIYTLMTIIRSLRVSSVEVLHLSGPKHAHRARTHYLQDARPFSAVHTVILERPNALMLFLDMHVGVWKYGVPDPDCDVFNMIFPSLQRIVLLEAEPSQEEKTRLLAWLDDRGERGDELKELCFRGNKSVDSRWMESLRRVVCKVVNGAGWQQKE